MTETIQTAEERYREILASRSEPAETVDIKAPSGMIFKFRKPSKYALLFATNRLPEFQTEAMIGPSNGDGEAAIAAASKEQQDELQRYAYVIRNRVIDLSVEPKLVMGTATQPNELSVASLAPEDLDYLYDWIVAGGDVGLALAKFRTRQNETSLASASRKKLRTKAVGVNGS